MMRATRIAGPDVVDELLDEIDRTRAYAEATNERGVVPSVNLNDRTDVYYWADRAGCRLLRAFVGRTLDSGSTESWDVTLDAYFDRAIQRQEIARERRAFTEGMG